jgi:sugar phosphate isomerase/epimerase
MTTDTLRFLDAARKLSFTHVELDIGKVEESIQNTGLPALKKKLRDHGIAVVSLNAIENYPILTEVQMDKALDRCRNVFSLCNELECDLAVVNPSEFEPAQKQLMQRRFDGFIEKAGRVAEKYKVHLGFEYVSYDNRVVNTLSKTIESLKRWDRDLRLVLDIFHIYRSKEKLAMFPQKIMNLLSVFHVNDAPAIPIEKVQDSDRVFPFEGVVEVMDFIRGLREWSFTGPVSVELFNKRYWEMDVDLVMAKAKESLEKLGIM